MTIIMVGADYFGSIIKATHHKDNVSASQLAHLFGCDLNQLHRYEEGFELIPRSVLQRVFKYAAMMDKMLEDK